MGLWNYGAQSGKVYIITSVRLKLLVTSKTRTYHELGLQRGKESSLDCSGFSSTTILNLHEHPLLTSSGSDTMHEENRKGLFASLMAYPSSVFFMLGNEFCERFSFYGMRAILMLYLITEHHFSESKASLFYHAFIALAYISPLIGSIAADNYFGRFRVILWVSVVYVFGHVLLSVGAIPQLDAGLRLVLDFGGLMVIALATGGIKPCVAAFAADQFDERQVCERNQFFSFFYFAINAGSLLAILLTPILRGRVKCFGSEYCFPLAFGVPGVLMLLAFIMFLAGWRTYKIIPPGKGNVVFSVVSCIFYAAREKICSIVRGHGHGKVEHWLDYAAPKYSSQFLRDVKSLVAVSILFIPVVLFWALFDQQGSTWVLQARRLDGRVGPFTILPDQMNILNPLFVLIIVPLFEAWLYPLVQKVCKVTSLRKMAVGGCLAALAFILAGLLQLEVNKTMEPCPQHGRVFLQRFGNSSSLYEINGTELVYGKNDLPEGQYLDIQPALISSPEYLIKFGPGNCSSNDCPYNYSISAEAGGAHVMYITDDTIELHTVVRPNTVNILWQLPQFLVITTGEVLFSVTGLEFSYSQASPDMKSVLQAIWLMTVFLGNVIDMLISGSHIVAEPAMEFFVYAVMMVIVIGLFVALSVRYTYRDYADSREEESKYIEKQQSQAIGMEGAK
uniref:Uncharacterized protein n=1 Tax=Setaria digitata TaxID=48799 RepID=A0A915Q7D1_9BILA